MENDLYIDSNYYVEHTHHSEDSVTQVDTFVMVKGDDTTVLVERTDKEYKLLEKLVDREDYGKNIFITLVSIFIIYSIIRKRNG
jgi:hypothetical protein